MFIAALLLAFISPLSWFHHKHKPVVAPTPTVLTRQSDISCDDADCIAALSTVQKEILFYQKLRDGLPAFRADEKMGPLEVDEIQTVQDDLDALAALTEPATNSALPILTGMLIEDMRVLSALDDRLDEDYYL